MMYILFIMSLIFSSCFTRASESDITSKELADANAAFEKLSGDSFNDRLNASNELWNLMHKTPRKLIAWREWFEAKVKHRKIDADLNGWIERTRPLRLEINATLKGIEYKFNLIHSQTMMFYFLDRTITYKDIGITGLEARDSSTPDPNEESDKLENLCRDLKSYIHSRGLVCESVEIPSMIHCEGIKTLCKINHFIRIDKSLKYSGIDVPYASFLTVDNSATELRLIIVPKLKR